VLKNERKLNILAAALVLTGLSLFYAADELVAGGFSGELVTRGFPVYFYDGHNLLFLRGLGNLLFYFFLVWSVWHLIDQGVKYKKWQPLKITAILAGLWFVVDIARSVSCVAGFPVEFFPKCGGDVATSVYLFGTVFDYLFWFSLVSILVAIFSALDYEKIGKLRYLIAPFILTFASFFYNASCAGEFCVLAGRGFPFAFYTDGVWNWAVFGVDFLIWMFVLYPLAHFLIKLYVKSLGESVRLPG